MTLEEAISWTERDIINLFGDTSFTSFTYYVAPWNDGYCVFPESYLKRHPNTKFVYDTKTKKINVDNLKANQQLNERNKRIREKRT